MCHARLVNWWRPSDRNLGVQEALTPPVATQRLSFQQSIRRTAALGGPKGRLVRVGMLSADG